MVGVGVRVRFVTGAGRDGRNVLGRSVRVSLPVFWCVWCVGGSFLMLGVVGRGCIVTSVGGGWRRIGGSIC